MASVPQKWWQRIPKGRESRQVRTPMYEMAEGVSPQRVWLMQICARFQGILVPERLVSSIG